MYSSLWKDRILASTFLNSPLILLLQVSPFIQCDLDFDFKKKKKAYVKVNIIISLPFSHYHIVELETQLAS